MGTVLEVKDLCKKFGRKQVLKNVSFTMEEGRILGFIGPNGAGKTTTIKLILGLQKIDSGRVKLNGFDIAKDFSKAIIKVGAIVESPDMYMYLSGRTNLEMCARLYNDIGKTRIDDVIELVGLENRIDDKVSKYSLGMRQRLGIAAALLHKPNVLILDEPTNGLDPEGIKELRDLLKRLAKEEKMAILISSHNLSELESFCTDVCIIKNGEIIEQTSIKEAKKKKKTTYIVKVDRTDGIEEFLKDSDAIISKDTIKIIRDKKDVPDLIKRLLNRGYLVYEFKLEELSLEDAFLEKAGGNIID